MSDKLSKLTGKNPKDYEPTAYNLINTADVELFAELVAKEDFLFDFVKQNVSSRLAKVCNQSNYLNLLKFLKYYSPSYEEFIVSTLAKYADEDLTDKMLEILETGTDDEKTYCAKFFSYIQDSLALELLQKCAYSENAALASNCASTLAVLGDKSCYEQALFKLNSADEFEKLDAVRFLVSYGNKNAINSIINAMKTSPMAENIAGEILYLTDLFFLIQTNKTDGLFVLNCVINGLGEILPLSQIFDFRLFEVFEMLLKNRDNSQTAVVLANAKDKFNTLTDNDEYLFDETKQVRQEVLDIKNLFSEFEAGNRLDEELKENSLFVYTAMDLSDNADAVRMLLTSSNQTIVLKALEVLKTMNRLTPDDKSVALSGISNEDIKNVILAI